MIQYFNIVDHRTVATDKPGSGTWVNVLPPLKQEEFSELSEALLIPLDFLKDSLDIDERSRYEAEDDVKLIVIKTPTENNSFNESDAFYITIPICILLTKEQIVTVNSFENEAIKKFQLMRIQKSLVYFVTALRSNELLLMKLARTDFLKLSDDEKDFLDDLVVETSQALETANTYTTILISTLDTFASIISNNQNVVLKRLTTITLFLSIPVLIASIYGMNVPLPFQHSPYAFWIPISISLIILAIVAFKFIKRKK